MSERVFKLGDTVRLRCGGQLMVVQKLLTSGPDKAFPGVVAQPIHSVECCWFSGDVLKSTTLLECVLAPDGHAGIKPAALSERQPAENSDNGDKNKKLVAAQ